MKKINLIVFGAAVVLGYFLFPGFADAVLIASQSAVHDSGCILAGSTSESHQKINLDVTTGSLDRFTYEVFLNAGSPTGLISLNVFSGTFDGTLVATSVNALDSSSVVATFGAPLPFVWEFFPFVMTSGVDYFFGIDSSADPVTGGTIGFVNKNTSGFVFDPLTGYTADRIHACGATSPLEIVGSSSFRLEILGAPPAAPPVILVPAGPVTIIVIPFEFSGTCSDIVTIDFFYDDNPGVSVGGATALCSDDTWSLSNGSLRDGDLTLEVCNIGTIVCDTEDILIAVGAGNPNPLEPEFGLFTTGFWLGQLTNLAELVKSKVPIRYFFDIKALWEAEVFLPASPPIVIITLPPGPVGGDYPILDLDATRAFIGDPTFDLMRDIARYGVWFGFILYLYHRYRSLVDV